MYTCRVSTVHCMNQDSGYISCGNGSSVNHLVAEGLLCVMQEKTICTRIIYNCCIITGTKRKVLMWFWINCAVMHEFGRSFWILVLITDSWLKDYHTYVCSSAFCESTSDWKKFVPFLLCNLNCTKLVSHRNGRESWKDHEMIMSFTHNYS